MTTATQLGVTAALRFRDVGNAVVTAALWLEYINETYLETLRSNPLLPFLETTEQLVTVTPPSRAATLAADIWTVNWVYDVTDDYRMIPQEGRGDQWHQDQARSATDIACTYRLRGNQLEVFPIPQYATQFAYEGVLIPAPLAAVTTLNGSAAGGVAGTLTCTGVDVGDTLLSVVGVKTSDQSVFDFTSQFSVGTVDDTITNAGGTATTGYVLTVTYTHTDGTGSPVWGAGWDSLLLHGAFAKAYLDDGNDKWFTIEQGLYTAAVKDLTNFFLFARTETNVPIRDAFWS